MADHLFVCYTADHQSDTDGGCQSHTALSLTPCCRTGRRWPLAPHFHGMLAEGKCTHLAALLCMWAPLQILTGLSYCLLAEPKATGHLHPRGGAGSASVEITVACVRVCD